MLCLKKMYFLSKEMGLNLRFIIHVIDIQYIMIIFDRKYEIKLMHKKVFKKIGSKMSFAFIAFSNQFTIHSTHKIANNYEGPIIVCGFKLHSDLGTSQCMNMKSLMHSLLNTFYNYNNNNT